jgi:hypothetical protein
MFHKKRAKKDYARYKILTGIFCAAAVLATVILSPSASAQIWADPIASPPSGNVSPPIWNQDAATQSGNFLISGSGTAGSLVSKGNFVQDVNNGWRDGIIFKRGTTGYTIGMSVSGTSLQFAPVVGGMEDNEVKMVMTAGGRVGIGTIDPQYALDVRALAFESPIYGESVDGFGIVGNSQNSYGVWAKNGLYASATGVSDYGALISSQNGPSIYAVAQTFQIGIWSTAPLGTAVYATGGQIGVSGQSDFGIGIYGASTNGQAGLFVGKVNVVGDLFVNDKKVCLEDGTNCGGSSSGSQMSFRLTRAVNNYNATLAAKDAMCVGEFGVSYQTANYADLVAHIGSLESYNIIVFGMVTSASQTARYYSEGSADQGYYLSSVTSGSYKVSCINKKAPLIVTRGTLAYNATLATKDARCVTEYGSEYQAASFIDVAAYLGKATFYDPLGATPNPGVLGLTSDSSNAAAMYYSGSWAGSFYGNPSSGSYPVYCLKK